MITKSLLWTAAVAQDVAAIANQRRLYLGDHGAVFLAAHKKLPFELVIPNLLGECLTEPLADLLFPDIPRVEAEGDAAALLAAIGWPDLLYPTATRLSYAGSAMWKLVWDAALGAPRLLLWGANEGEYATCTPDGRLVNFWYAVEVEGAEFQVRETHAVGADGTTVSNTAFRRQGPLVETTPAPWDAVAGAWEPGQQPAAELTLPGLTLLPGYRLENVQGASDYTLSRRNIQWRMILLESARNFSVALTTVPQLLVPAEAVNPHTGQLDWEQLVFRIRRPEDGHMVTIDLKQAVTSLGDSSAVLQNLWDDWNAICPISPIFYGKAVGSAASGKALSLSLLGTERAVTRRRRAYTPATRWAAHFAAQLRHVYAGTPPASADPLTLCWPAAIPEDRDLASQRIDRALRGGWMSRRQAIREEHPDWTPAQVEEELRAIREEVAR